jgi:hypothetical protein
MKRFNFLIAFSLLFSSFISAQVTWTSDVAKILYANCTTCHRPGGVGPFSLMTYQDAFLYRNMVNYSISTSSMPPWNADPNYKRYAHDRVLSQTDISKIQQWVTDGAPSGDLRFAPPAPTYTNGSKLGTVDLSLRMNPYTVQSNNDEYRNFIVPSGLTQATYATAIEIIPGNSGIVHHVLVFQDSTNNPITTTSSGGTGSSASKLIYEYVPGAQPYFTPQGTGFRLGANTRIIFQVHYAPGSQGQVDSTRINFKLTPNPVREISVNSLLNHFATMTNGPLSIPANTTRTFNESVTFPGNWTFLTASPHMHLIGRSFLTYAVKNTAPFDTIRFVNIPEWDFNWQDNFVFQNALKIPNGYSLKATATYDNTPNNPFNPFNPPQNISAGEATTEEMMMVFFSYLPYVTGDENLIIDKRIFAKGATTFCNGITVTLKTIEGTGYTYQWFRNGTAIAGATSATYEAGLSGSYTVSITLGPNNAVSDPVQVTVNPSPTATITPAGSTSIPTGGSVVLNGSTCTGCSYQWFLNGVAISGATSSSYTATAAGTYELEVFNGCYAVSSPVVVSSTSCAITTNTNSINATCNASNGSASVSVSGGTAPYTYLWNNGNNTANINNVAAGSYTVTVTDANNCSSVRTVTVSSTNTTLTATSNTQNASCGSTNGSATVSPTNGTAPYSFAWSTGSNQQSISNLAAGSYTVSITDANGCLGVISGILVNNLNAPSASTSVISNVSCNGGSNGSASVTASGGTAPYSYNWSNNANTTAISNLSAGTYTVTVTDANNCSQISTVNISQPAAISVNNTRVNVNCYGGSNGSVSITASGGTAPYSYNWSNNANTSAVSNLSAGTYTVTVTDANNCSQISTVNITEPTAINLTFTSTDATSAGSSDAAINLTVAGGVSPYSFNWSNGQNSEDLSSITAGNYTVTVTDANGCNSVLNVTVADGPTSVSIADHLFDIRLFPNPSEQQTTLSVKLENQSDISFEVFNQIGQSVYQLNDSAVKENQYNINTSLWAAGFYYLRLSANGKTVTLRLSVK